ncbi:hypothetical protein [Methylobacterium oryzae]|uniref:hypothetical protein n=1 Tax=Methylobacterium oryzae TaxID=334852 RepID=UPI002F3610E3
MDQISEHMWAVGVGAVVFAFLVLSLGAKLVTGSFNIAGLISGNAAGRRGATVSKVRIKGEENKLGAKGTEATVERTDVKGKRNEIKAET